MTGDAARRIPTGPRAASTSDPADDGSAITRELAAAQSVLARLTPRQAWAAAQAGEVILVDIRSDAQRAEFGEVPGAIVMHRNILEWRLDPTSPWRIPEADAPAARVVVVCHEGYASSLAAVSLMRLGLTDATDIVGGMEAWIADGLPVDDGPADVRL